MSQIGAMKASKVDNRVRLPNPTRCRISTARPLTGVTLMLLQSVGPNTRAFSRC